MIDKKRMSYIDVAKGIGILLVILGHCLAYGCQNQLFRCIYSFHMPLFFFLSGYVFHSKEATVFFSGKLKALLLPALFFQIINLMTYVAVVCGVGIAIGKNLAIYHGLISFGGFWFVITLLYVSSLFYVFYEKIVRRFAKKNWIMFCTALFLLVIGLIYASSIADKPNEPIATTMTAFFFYTVGVILNPKWTRIDSDLKSRTIAFFVGAVFLGLCFYLNGFSAVNVDFNTSRYGNKLLFVATALTGSFAIFLISCAISKSRILEWYGKNSLMLLFVHIPLWKSFDFVISHFTAMRGGCKSIVVFLITLLLSTLAVCFINRHIPFIAGQIVFPKTEE